MPEKASYGEKKKGKQVVIVKMKISTYIFYSPCILLW